MALRQRAAHRLSRASEQIIEWAIRLCGWSAIFFVFSILFFVFREAAPALGAGLSLKEFFTSQNWRPDLRVESAYLLIHRLVGADISAGSALFLGQGIEQNGIDIIADPKGEYP